MKLTHTEFRFGYSDSVIQHSAHMFILLHSFFFVSLPSPCFSFRPLFRIHYESLREKRESFVLIVFYFRFLIQVLFLKHKQTKRVNEWMNGKKGDENEIWNIFIQRILIRKQAEKRHKPASGSAWISLSFV